MKYQVAFREAEELQTVVQRWLQTDQPADIGHLLQKCKVVVNNIYPVAHQFPNAIDSLVLNFEGNHYSVRIRKLAELLDLIVGDLRMKSKMDVFPKSNLQELNESQTKIADIQKKKKDLEDEIIRHKDNEIKRIETIKKLQETIDDLVAQLKDFKARKQPPVQHPSLFYKISFYVMSAVLLTVVNFFAPIYYGFFSWIVFWLIELLIVVAIPVLYFRRIAGWVQFILGFFIAVLAIIMAYLQFKYPEVAIFLNPNKEEVVKNKESDPKLNY